MERGRSEVWQQREGVSEVCVEGAAREEGEVQRGDSEPEAFATGFTGALGRCGERSRAGGDGAAEADGALSALYQAFAEAVGAERGVRRVAGGEKAEEPEGEADLPGAAGGSRPQDRRKRWLGCPNTSSNSPRNQRRESGQSALPKERIEHRPLKTIHTND